MNFRKYLRDTTDRMESIKKIVMHQYGNLITKFMMNVLEKSNVFENEYLKFMVVSNPRTGSTLLVHLLNSHPDILCHGEIFHWKAIFSMPLSEKKCLPALNDRNRNPVRFLEQLFSDGYGSKAIGIKMFQNHNPAMLNFLIRKREVKKIILKRNNYLETYTSHLIAKQTKKYYNYPDGFVPPKVNVDPAKFLNYIKKNENFFTSVISQLEKTGQNYFLVDYKEILDKGIRKDLLEFIGVNSDISLTASNKKKQNPAKLSERISNYSEIKENL